MVLRKIENRKNENNRIEKSLENISRFRRHNKSGNVNKRSDVELGTPK
jgi:hypothetical protein